MIALIWFYSGTPGSGKSFHVAKKIWFSLKTLRDNVISTVNVDTDIISKNGKKKIGDFTYIPILDLQTDFLYRYAIKNHVKGKEGQTLLIIDECQIIFNPREYQRNNRADWILFFTRHRHLGYNIILISQFDRLVDRQIRSLFEYEVKHRKINNLGILFALPFTMFVCIETWYGVKNVTISTSFMFYRRKISSIYDSYAMYDDYFKEYALADGAHVDTFGNENAESHEAETEPIPTEAHNLADPQTGVRGSPSEGKPAKGLIAGIRRWLAKT